MALAQDEIIITFDGERLTLRPTLRAAMRLERRLGGFDKIVAALAEQKVSVMAEIVAECADRPAALVEFLTNDHRRPMAYKVGALVAPLVELVAMLAGVDEDDTDENSGDGARISYAEHHARLFSIATGWLGWTPDAAWSATPAEIRAAHAGRVELLHAIFGTGEDKPTPMSEDALAAFLRSRAA